MDDENLLWLDASLFFFPGSALSYNIFSLLLIFLLLFALLIFHFSSRSFFQPFCTLLFSLFYLLCFLYLFASFVYVVFSACRMQCFVYMQFSFLPLCSTASRHLFNCIFSFISLILVSSFFPVLAYHFPCLCLSLSLLF